MITVSPQKLLLLLLLLLLTSACGQKRGSSVSRWRGYEAGEENPTWIILQVTKIELLNAPNDLDRVNDFQFLIAMGGKDPAHSAAMVFPREGTIAMKVGDVLGLGAFALAVSEEAFKDRIVVSYMGIDSDKAPQEVQIGLAILTELVSRVADERIPGAGTVVAFIIDRMSDYIQKDDLIGAGLFELRKSQDWNMGRHVITSENGTLRITYRVFRISAKSSGSWRALAPSDEECRDAPKPQLKAGSLALVTTRVSLNLRSQPRIASGNIIEKMRPKDVVQVLEGPVCTDGYYWWCVRSQKGNKGWAAEGDSHLRYLTPFSRSTHVSRKCIKGRVERFEYQPNPINEIWGRLLDEHGSPLSGWQVEAYVPGYEDRYRVPTVTGKDGSFYWPALTPTNEYGVRVLNAPYRSKPVTFWYPDKGPYQKAIIIFQVHPCP